jgi:hypothetical protein
MGDAMTSRVSRGLLATESRVIFGRVDATNAAEVAFERLSSEPPRGYAWKERAQWARRLARGDADFYGRRVFSDAGRSDCRYVAKVCRRAWNKGNLPEGRAWGNLRASLLRTFEELCGRGDER